MNIPYRTRRILNRIGTVFLAVLLVLIPVWFCWVVWLERYVVYTRDGATLDLNISANDIVGEVAAPPVAGGTGITIYYNDGSAAVETSTELTQLDGYYVDANALTKDIAGAWDMMMNLSSGTPVMIDLKGGYGSFYYSSSLPDAINSQSVSVASVDELIKDMKKKGFYTIARISAFRDYNYGLNHVPQGLYMLSKAGLWADEGGCYWLDPTNSAVLNWISSIVNELKNMGFQEVVLSDFRFPAGDKYIFKGDKTAALESAAATLMENCGSDTFTLSFAVSDASFTLPEGRCRMYLEGVSAENVGIKASQALMDDPEIRLVFVAETNDPRETDYSVLRPSDVADVLEAQKAEARARAEANGGSTNTGSSKPASTATVPPATAAPETSGPVG